MKVEVEGGSSASWRIQRAVLFYAEDAGRRVLATAHEIKETPSGLEIREGSTLAKSAIDDLITRMGERVKTRVALPENVLWHEPEVLVWWRPSTKGKILFKTSDEKFNEAATGATVVHPPLLFAANRRRLWMWALKENRRPKPDDPLFYAPYMNVSTAGWVCTGSAIPPKETTPLTLKAWEDTVFDSYFSHSGITFGQWKSVREFWAWYTQESRAQLQRDKKKPLPFPTDSLKAFIDPDKGKEVDLKWLLEVNLGRMLAGQGEGYYVEA